MLTIPGIAETGPSKHHYRLTEPKPHHGNLDHLRHLVDRQLRTLLPSEQQIPKQLHAAMSYSLLAPGKRLRPVLALLTSRHFGLDEEYVVDPACALEMVHTASLIMDDLPAMDNAKLRRGKPTTHLVFGDDVAMLAAVGLLNQAYAVIGNAKHLSESVRGKLMRCYAHAIGGEGLVGGQIIDLKERDVGIDAHRLEAMNKCKTAALFVAAVETGAIAANIRGAKLEAARNFANSLGLAFQIADDLLDDPRYSGRTGKDTGKDHAKPTVVSLLGRDLAKAQLARHISLARRALTDMNANASPLTAFFEASFSCLDEGTR